MRKSKLFWGRGRLCQRWRREATDFSIRRICRNLVSSGVSVFATSALIGSAPSVFLFDWKKKNQAPAQPSRRTKAMMMMFFLLWKSNTIGEDNTTSYTMTFCRFLQYLSRCQTSNFQLYWWGVVFIIFLVERNCLLQIFQDFWRHHETI